MTLKAILSNLILSRLDIARAKRILGDTPVLSVFFKLISQSLIDKEYPAHLFLETTRACNLHCKSCPRSILTSGYGHMNFGLFKKIIDEAGLFGRRNFCLHMLGEPLMHPEIVKLVGYIKSSPVRHSILLTTNGYFLDAAKAKTLIENKVDKIVVSIFSLRKDRLNSLTGNTDITKVVDNISSAVMLNKELSGKTNIYIRFLLHPENQDELESVSALAKRIGAHLEVRATHNYSGLITENSSKEVTPGKRYPCYHPWFSPAITWDGKVVLCCNDWNYSEILGDATKDTIASIWQSSRIKELRKLHLKGRYDEINLCKACNVWSLYPDIFFKMQKKRR